jgi:hypothetical protein
MRKLVEEVRISRKQLAFYRYEPQIKYNFWFEIKLLLNLKLHVKKCFDFLYPLEWFQQV